MPYGYPVLTPTYGLGSYGRTSDLDNLPAA